MLMLYLQDALGLTPLQAGLTFAAYATGFAAASLTWTRAARPRATACQCCRPLLMGSRCSALGLVAASGGWPVAVTLPLLAAAGVGHARAFSPLANRPDHAGAARPGPPTSAGSCSRRRCGDLDRGGGVRGACT